MAIDRQTREIIAVERALVAAFNTTEFYNGFFGLGITSGRFDNEQVESPFTQMVQKYGWFQSYSYGYTAGAYYSA
jgi:hypothetical protein